MSPLAQIVPPSFPGPEGRLIARTSILVAASLRFGAQMLAVRIRNMSATGALIEGANLPLPNCRIELVRGSLRASGRIAWVNGHRCGVALDEQVAVERWISGKMSAHQALVDTMVDEARQAIGARPGQVTARQEPRPGTGLSDVASVAEIDAIIASLVALGERLTDDPSLVASYMDDLQILDEAQQRLAALKRRLA